MASEIEHHHGQPTAPTGSIGGNNADTAFDEPRTSRSFTDFNAAPLTVSTDWKEESRKAGGRIAAAVGKHQHQHQLGFPSLGHDDGDDDDSSAATTASADNHYLHVNGNGHGGSNNHGGGGSEDGIGSGSETMTSPSVTSPPYWAHGHGRTVSNVSVESVLPAGAITLQDNECDDDDDDQNRRAANVIGRDRNRACWAKSVEITDSVMVNGSTTNIGAFVVWNIRVQTLNGSHMNIRKRYSEFDDLRRRLVQTFPGFEAAVPVLPPKSILSNFKPRFLEKRRAGLQYFLNCILLNPEFSGSPVLKEFLFS